jgi:hypothetical protein
MSNQFIKIGNQDLKLKVNLGFYKNLSFPKSEINTINDNFSRLFEVVKLAVYFGNKEEKGWHSLADMSKEISDEEFDDIDDPNILPKISEAIFENLPDSLKDYLKEKQKESEEELKKK